jgi:hypothetical protein
MGVLTSEDLVAPGVIARPEQQVRLLALHFHPDSRAHRMVLAQELQTPWFPLGEDILLIDLKDTDPILELVCLAVELGTPIRDHIRGVVLQGLGRWSPHGLLGPLASEAFPRLRSRPWGQVASIESLPDVIGSPPSSQRWWLAAAGASLAAVCLCWVAFGSSLYPHPAFPLETEFHADDGFQWLSFDVDEAAIVTLVAQNAGQLRVISGPQTPAEKGRFAVGDGSFRLKSSGEALLIVSSKDPIDGLAQHLTSAGSDETPLANLAARIKASSPHSELMMFNP